MLLLSSKAPSRTPAGRRNAVSLPSRPRISVRAQAGPEVAHVVKDIMSTNLFTVQPEDTVDYALEVLVENRITGMPVVDGEGRVVGVVSDFDLLALDAVGRLNEDNNLFPSADQSWQAFKEVKKMLAKSAGRKIRDVMTPQPITVSPETNLNEATSILISRKIRRLPVVDEAGRLVGLISRGNIVKAALAARKAAVVAVRN